MNNITIFNHLGNDIRVMTDEHSEKTFLVSEAGLYEAIIRKHTPLFIRPLDT